MGVFVPSILAMKSAIVPVFAFTCSPPDRTARKASKLNPAEAALKFEITFVRVLKKVKYPNAASIVTGKHGYYC